MPIDNDPFATERNDLRNLIKELFRLQGWLKEIVVQSVKPPLDFESYMLVELGEGSFGYAFKGEPPHHICANCYSKGDKSVLQKTGTEPILADNLFCPLCQTTFLADKL